MDKLRLIVETYYDYQKGRQSYANRLNRFPKEVREKIEKETVFERVSTDLESLEKTLINAIGKELKDNEIYEKLLSRIKGMGVVMSGGIISWVCTERDFTIGKTHPALKIIKELKYAKTKKVGKDLVRVKMPSVLDIAKYPSDFYKYCGLIPGSRKVKGEQISYNPKVKTHFWKMMRQILLARKSHYVIIYNMEKANFLKKYEKEYNEKVNKLKSKAKDEKELKKLIKQAKLGSPKMKAHLTAIKKTARHLALSIYLTYKFTKKQKAYLPYPISIMGHEIEPPFVDGENGKPEILEFLIDYAEKLQ